MGDNNDKNLVMIQNIFKEYKNNPNRDESYKQSILNKAYNIRENTDILGLWRVVFSSDKEMYTRLDNLSVQVMAESSLRDYQEEPIAVLLEQIASLAHTQCSGGRLWNHEKENIWNQVFSSVAEFKDVLQEEKNYWNQWLAKTENDHKAYFDEIKKPKPELLDTIKMSVPVIVMEKYKISEKFPPQTLVDYIVNHFNGFELQSYMKIPHDLVQKSYMELIDSNFIFTFECSKILNNKENNLIMKELVGQLSDGWGNCIEQHNELIGNSEFSLSFNYKQIKFDTQTKTKN